MQGPGKEARQSRQVRSIGRNDRHRATCRGTAGAGRRVAGRRYPLSSDAAEPAGVIMIAEKFTSHPCTPLKKIEGMKLIL